ncbi:hypothetical protein [Sulfitobacter sp. S190]|uniref:hypothetical protein n=1 Tax=Sulfitobacter sp. S190 TaxID=2867022 RepID=UPI0021A688E1|nr:hypothetical protein [Sulfitobacter sp. S190]UWR21234.1 hypothetical protein K3756_10950 [Sulfitobacter sp. S190]
MTTTKQDDTGLAGKSSTPLRDDAAPKPLAGRRILFAEDEVLIALDVSWELEEAGASLVGPLSTFDETMAAVETETFEAAILDIDLRGDLSFPIAERLRQLNVPFVFATGNGLQYDLETRFPAIPVVHKPYSAAYLLKEVAKLLQTTA